jgi:hypothetical protein
LVGGENNMDERLKALEIAMKLEEEGKKFYMDASEKATSAYAKEMFGSLAKDEDVHQEKVNEIYKKLKEEILKRGSISHLRMRSVDIISVSGIIGNILRTLRDGLV